MVTTTEIFRAALGEATERYGAQTELAEKTGFSPSKINNILTGARVGDSEDDHRLIAAALGYPDAQYEAFLDIGRAKLGLPTFAAIEEVRQKAPKPIEIKEYSAKLEKLYTLKNYPGFDNVCRSIDDWLRTLEQCHESRATQKAG